MKQLGIILFVFVTLHSIGQEVKWSLKGSLTNGSVKVYGVEDKLNSQDYFAVISNRESQIDTITFPFSGYLPNGIDTMFLQSIQIDKEGQNELLISWEYETPVQTNYYHSGKEIEKINKIINLDTRKEMFSAVEFYFHSKSFQPWKKDDVGNFYVDTASYSYDFTIDSYGIITIGDLKSKCVRHNTSIQANDNQKKTMNIATEIVSYDCSIFIDHRPGTYRYRNGMWQWITTEPYNIPSTITYTPLDKEFYRGSDGFLYIKTFMTINPPLDGDREIFRQVPEIDVSSYEFIGESHYYAKDKNKIYYIPSSTEGKQIFILIDADLDTFEAIGYEQAKDKNHEYNHGIIVK